MEESEQQWKGVENAIEDPEEARVIYCALDSFVSVVPPNIFASIWALNSVRTLAASEFKLFMLPAKEAAALGPHGSAPCTVVPIITPVESGLVQL